MLGTNLQEISKAAAETLIRAAVELEARQYEACRWAPGVMDCASMARRGDQLEHEYIDEAKDRIRSNGRHLKTRPTA